MAETLTQDHNMRNFVEFLSKDGTGHSGVVYTLFKDVLTDFLEKEKNILEKYTTTLQNLSDNVNFYNVKDFPDSKFINQYVDYVNKDEFNVDTEEELNDKRCHRLMTYIWMHIYR